MKPSWVRAVIAISLFASTTAWAGWFDDYKSLDEYNLKLDEFVSSYPTLASPVTLGSTHQGRTIRGVRFTGTGPSTVAKKTVFFDGVFHAREWIAGMVPMYAADQLLSGYGTDPRITQILDNVEFIISPVVNQDGYEYTRTTDRLWRKNRRPNPGGSFGVDLNRNFGVGWGLNSGSSGNPTSETYRGPSPFSEPESQAIRDTIEANPNIVSYVSFHSYSQLLLEPWGYQEELPPDHDVFNRISTRMAATIESVHGEEYVHGPASTTLYLASGVSTDWAYGDEGIYSYVIELRPDTFFPGFQLPPEQIIPTGEEIFPAMLDLAEFTMALAGGDFNYDQEHNCTDVDRLISAIINGTTHAEYDVTGDSLVDGGDLSDWLARAGAANLASGNPYLPGDANLDGSVDGSDFNIWNANKFTSTPSWCGGDFNADGSVDGSDFNIWNSKKFLSSDFDLVPEPTTLLVGWFLLLIPMRRSWAQ